MTREETVLSYLREHDIPFTNYNHPEGKTIEEGRRRKGKERKGGRGGGGGRRREEGKERTSFFATIRVTATIWYASTATTTLQYTTLSTY